MIYENTRNLVSVVSFRHPDEKNLNINPITIPVLISNTGASIKFLKQENIMKLVNIKKFK